MAANSDPLKFVALDGEDLEVVSTHLQDAVVKSSEVLWRPREHRFVMALNRFDWESAVQPGQPEYRRRRAALRFERVQSCKSRGLDPGATQTALVVGTVADAVGTYTYRVLGGGKIAPDPAWVSSHIATETMPIIGSMTCNKAIFPQLRAALTEIQQAGLAPEIHPGEYAGCFYPRFIAGTTTLSNHAFGLAIDINAPENARGTAGQMNRQVVAIFQRWGFTWGGVWHYTDPMHFEMNKIVTPR